MNKEMCFLRKDTNEKTNAEQCPYCKGEGYFQLKLGGSETCGHCLGSGKKLVKI